MPIYEYRCKGCGKEQEAFQSFSEEPLETCPHCGGLLKKLVSNTSFVLKGSGWYADGYASPDRGRAIEKDGSASGDKKASGNSESKAA